MASHCDSALSWLSKLTDIPTGTTKNCHKKINMWVFPKIVGFPPKSSILMGFFHYKPSILGYPYFWKHPCVYAPPLPNNSMPAPECSAHARDCFQEYPGKNSRLPSWGKFQPFISLGINSPFMGNHFTKGMSTHKALLFRLMSVSLTPWKMNMGTLRIHP